MDIPFTLIMYQLFCCWKGEKGDVTESGRDRKYFGLRLFGCMMVDALRRWINFGICMEVKE